MKNHKKFNPFIVGLCLILLGFITSCDNYERKGIVTPEITVNEHSLNLFVGQTAELKASPIGLAITWSSEDTQVATVDNNGTVTAVGAGNTFIFARSGSMYCRVPVSALVRISLTDFDLGATNLLWFPREKQQFIPVMIPRDANDITYPFWTSRNSNIATVDYKGEVIAVNPGTTQIECRVGAITKTLNIEVIDSYPMFGPNKITASAPSLIKFIDFDFGGEGVAYHDNDAGNSGGNNYRANGGDPNCGVDIGNDLAVGWTGAGEWLKYTVICFDEGEYNLSLDLAGDGESEIYFEVDGVNVTGSIIIPRTGGWSSWLWQDIEPTFYFSEGRHTILFYLERAGSNFRTMRFTYKN